MVTKPVRVLSPYLSPICWQCGRQNIGMSSNCNYQSGFRLSGTYPAFAEIDGAFLGREACEYVAEGIPECGDGSGGDLAANSEGMYTAYLPCASVTVIA